MPCVTLELDYPDSKLLLLMMFCFNVGSNRCVTSTVQMQKISSRKYSPSLTCWSLVIRARVTKSTYSSETRSPST